MIVTYAESFGKVFDLKETMFVLVIGFRDEIWHIDFIKKPVKKDERDIGVWIVKPKKIE